MCASVLLARNNTSTSVAYAGILITVKQRQEFRIRLQKRARRKAEKRIDHLEEERHSKNVSMN